VYKARWFLVAACLGVSSFGCAFSPDDSGYGLAGGGPNPSPDASPPPLASTDSGTGADVDAMATPDTAAPSDDASPNPRTPDVAAPQCTLSIPTGEPSCDLCLEQSCCGVDNMCGQDQNCIAVIECMDDCLISDAGPDARPDGGPDAGPDAAPPDPNACINQCMLLSATGAAELNALANCVASQCPGSC
jgi:hypothetical protein